MNEYVRNIYTFGPIDKLVFYPASIGSNIFSRTILGSPIKGSIANVNLYLLNIFILLLMLP